MDTKTRKSEALELLALDELTGKDVIRLNVLTVQQAGYMVTEFSDGTFGLSKSDGDDLPSWDNHYSGEEAWEDTPDYCLSVDACLTLISKHRYTVHHLMGSFRVRLYPENADVEGVYADARSLSISILKAWWSMQP